jgi:hypothetical protein
MRFTSFDFPDEDKPDDDKPDDSLPTYPSQDPGTFPAYDQTPPPVPFDEAYILEVVIARARKGRDMVRRYYFAVWNAARGVVMEELDQEIRVLKNRLTVLLREVDRTNRDYQRQQALTPWANWDAWALARFIVAVIFSIVLAVASFAGTFQLLSNSPAFAGSLKICFAVAALVLAIPFAIELFTETLRTEEARIRINRIYAAATGVLFVLFAILLAITTGGNGAGLPDPLSVADGVMSLWGQPLAVHLQIVQLILEVVASLACFSYAAMLYVKHRTRWPGNHPVCERLMLRAARAQEVYAAENRRLGGLEGRRRALLADRSAYVFHAVVVFLRKADMAKRQESGIQRKQGAEGRSGAGQDSFLKRSFDRFTDYFNN